MSTPIITVEGLSKRYFIGHQRPRGDGLRHAIEHAVRNPWAWFKVERQRWAAGQKEEFWALRDVSFAVHRGEVVGIIGRNGAGKSTLLKILSRITEPTTGQIRIKGRVASLLEVGTGFHPELTGRDNIFLNGAILGMTRAEIRCRFDEIVAFSEIEKFLDTPVKRYSSGMYVRLAFAVAAHLEPEILIVDEVLAVGDSAFQKKCLGKMSEVSKQGRTVLFVSHSMATVAHLCQRCIMLRNGILAADGNVAKVIDAYLVDFPFSSNSSLAQRRDRSGTGEVVATAIEWLNREDKVLKSLITGQALCARLHFRCQPGRVLRDSRAGLAFSRGEQTYFVLSTWMADNKPLHLEGVGFVDFIIPEFPLAAGTYVVHSFLESNELYDAVERAAEISVVDGDFYLSGRIRPTADWQNVGGPIKHSYRLGSGYPVIDSAPS